MMVVMVLASFRPCSATDIFFQTIDTKDGLADNFVRDITRDTYGYIWIATINGLSRYDGYRLTNYMPILFGGSANDVSMVRETADTTLWIVSISDLYTYDRQQNTWQKDGAARLAALGVEGTMRRFYVDDRHNLWVATETGLYHYDYAQRKVQHFSNYSGSAKLGVAFTDMNSPRFDHISTGEYEDVSSLIQDGKGNLWIGFDGGGLIMKSPTGTTTHFSTAMHQLPSNIVTSLATDRNGSILVGTYGDGIARYDGNRFSHVMTIIETNMPNVNYSVAQLSSDVGMTRGHLYKKLMAITGKSPLEFMRIMKLKRGKSLLDQGRTNISEVADMVGLSAKQFAHYFKLMYDDTPSEYLKKRK